MAGKKTLYYKVFNQFILFPSFVRVYGHYYTIKRELKPFPTVRAMGSTVSVFQYTTTAEEAQSLMRSMFSYAKGKKYLELPHHPMFNHGQEYLF